MRNVLVALILALVILPLHGTALSSERPGEGVVHDDAHSGQDADDHCTPGRLPAVMVHHGGDFDGMLVPPDDQDDHYGLDLKEGGAVHITYTAATAAPVLAVAGAPERVFLVVLDAECSFLAGTTSSDGHARIALELDPGLYVVGIWGRDPAGGAVASPASATAKTMCHPPCTFAGYTMTIE